MKVILLKIMAFGLGTPGALMLLSTFLNIGMIPDELGDWLLMLFVLSLLPLGLAFLAYRKAQKLSTDQAYRDSEAKIIALAQQQNGTITIGDVAVKTSMTFKEAEEQLKEMYLNGLFDMDSNEKGQIEYYLRS